MSDYLNMHNGMPIISSNTDRYVVLNHLGRGSFGTVTMCQSLRTRKDVAIKTMNANDAQLEVNILEDLSQWDGDRYNFVKFFEQIQLKGMTCLVFEMLDFDLCDLMSERRNSPLTMVEIRPIAQQLFVALDLLSYLGILHTDIKPNNIMLVNRWEQPLRVKLIDFGLAVRKSDTFIGKQMQATGFRAPEVSLGLPITEAIDLWGLGCTLAYLFLGEYLFSIQSEFQMMRQIIQIVGQPDGELLLAGLYSSHFFKVEAKHKKYTWEPLTAEEYKTVNKKTKTDTCPMLKMTLEEVATMNTFESLENRIDKLVFVNLLRQLLEFDANKRISADEAMQHEFFKMNYLKGPLFRSYHRQSQCAMEACNRTVQRQPRISKQPTCRTYNWDVFSGFEDYVTRATQHIYIQQPECFF